MDVVATEAECEGLKERFDLVDLKSLKADGRIDKRAREWVLTATLEAELAQRCVVTLKPVPAVVKASFERRYRVGDGKGGDGRAAIASGVDLDLEDADVDMVESDHIDIGEAIAEEFYLALDPYPRAKDADRVLAEVQGRLGGDDDASADNPFAKLRRH